MTKKQEQKSEEKPDSQESEEKQESGIVELKSLFPTQEELLNGEKKSTDLYQEEAVNKEENVPEFEKEALAQGWVPKDEFKGDGDNWRTAKEYVDRGKMIDRISHQSDELRTLRKSNDELITLVKKQSERLTQEQADETLEKKRTAIAEGDIESAEKYEEQYLTYKREMDSFKDLQLKEQTNSTVPVEYQAFIERNKGWFNNTTAENTAMAMYADRVEVDLKQQYPDWPLIRRLEEVEKNVKQFFRDKFENPNRFRAPSVEPRTIARKTESKKVTFDNLPDDAKRIVKSMLRADRTGKMSKDEYAQQLALTGAITIEK